MTQSRIGFLKTKLCTCKISQNAHNEDSKNIHLQKLNDDIFQNKQDSQNQNIAKFSLLKNNDFRFIILLFAIYIFGLLGLYFYNQIDILKNIIFIIFVILYFVSGKEIIINALFSIKKLHIFDENFLMLIASLSAFAIGHFEEALAVMLFVKLGNFLEDFATEKSKNNISSLFSKMPETAHVKYENTYKIIDAKNLKIDDEILVPNGSSVPIDCVILEGCSSFNLAAINGESMPQFFSAGNIIKQGAINLDSAIKCKVIKNFEDSSISIILKMIQHAQYKKAKTERFITYFAKFYTPIVFFLCFFIAFVCPFIVGGNMQDWGYRALVVLMVSCPCALLVSIPISYFSAIGIASKKGILIKGASFLDSLNHVKFIAFDKTATLTKGIFELINTKTIDFDNDMALFIAKTMQFHSNHPISNAFKNIDIKNVDSINLRSIEEIKSRGLSAKSDIGEILLGSNIFLEDNGILHENIKNPTNEKNNILESKNTKNDENDKYLKIYLAINKKIVAIFYLHDCLKDDTKEAIEKLRHFGTEKIHILSGDNENKTKEIATALQCTYNANLSAKDKEIIFENMMSEIKKHDKYAVCAFVGDGINDSIVLKRSDIGFSIGEKSSDLSKESSDIVLLKDSINQICDAVKIARKTRMIVWENIIFALSIKIAFIILGLNDVANLWEAVFGDVGVSMLALLNASRIAKIK